MAFYFTRKIKSLNTANWIDSNPDVMADNMEPREFTQVREIKKQYLFQWWMHIISLNSKKNILIFIFLVHETIGLGKGTGLRL